MAVSSAVCTGDCAICNGDCGVCTGDYVRGLFNMCWGLYNMCCELGFNVSIVSEVVLKDKSAYLLLGAIVSSQYQ